jgi:hypothetical protein
MPAFEKIINVQHRGACLKKRLRSEYAPLQTFAPEPIRSSTGE